MFHPRYNTLFSSIPGSLYVPRVYLVLKFHLFGEYMATSPGIGYCLLCSPCLIIEFTTDLDFTFFGVSSRLLKSLLPEEKSTIWLNLEAFKSSNHLLYQRNLCYCLRARTDPDLLITVHPNEYVVILFPSNILN